MYLFLFLSDLYFALVPNFSVLSAFLCLIKKKILKMSCLIVVITTSPLLFLRGNILIKTLKITQNTIFEGENMGDSVDITIANS